MFQKELYFIPNVRCWAINSLYAFKCKSFLNTRKARIFVTRWTPVTFQGGGGGLSLDLSKSLWLVLCQISKLLQSQSTGWKRLLLVLKNFVFYFVHNFDSLFSPSSNKQIKSNLIPWKQRLHPKESARSSSLHLHFSLLRVQTIHLVQG
jgi:hypothetical protein